MCVVGVSRSVDLCELERYVDDKVLRKQGIRSMRCIEAASRSRSRNTGAASSAASEQDSRQEPGFACSPQFICFRVPSSPTLMSCHVCHPFSRNHISCIIISHVCIEFDDYRVTVSSAPFDVGPVAHLCSCDEPWGKQPRIHKAYASPKFCAASSSYVPWRKDR